MKFTTMNDKKDKRGTLRPDNKRLTKIGHFVRKSSLDELPQLFNILSGDMSFIGPRPLLKKYLPYYKTEERIRHSVKPGITGLAQISGRNLLSWDEKFALDMEYVNNLSFSNDLKIIAGTIPKLLKSSEIVVNDNNILVDLDVERNSKKI